MAGAGPCIAVDAAHSDVVGWLAQRLAPWLAAEVAPGRLMPWSSVAFGTDVVLYFSGRTRAGAGGPGSPLATALAERDDPGASAADLRFLLLARRLPPSRPALRPRRCAPRGADAIRSWARAAYRPASALEPAPSPVTSRARTHRPHRHLGAHQIEAQLHRRPARPRLPLDQEGHSVRRLGSLRHRGQGAAEPACLQPLRPGGYDFARDMYFHGIGASGFANGAIKIEAPPEPPGLGIRFATLVEGIRDAIDARIRAVIKGDAGSIASALLTGKRDALTTAGSTTPCSSPASAMCCRSPATTWRQGRWHRVLRGAALLALVPASPAQCAADQEVGGVRGTGGGDRSIWCCPAPRWRRSARIS